MSLVTQLERKNLTYFICTLCGYNKVTQMIDRLINQMHNNIIKLCPLEIDIGIFFSKLDRQTLKVL